MGKWLLVKVAMEVLSALNRDKKVSARNGNRNTLLHFVLIVFNIIFWSIAIIEHLRPAEYYITEE